MSSAVAHQDIIMETMKIYHQVLLFVVKTCTVLVTSLLVPLKGQMYFVALGSAELAVGSINYWSFHWISGWKSGHHQLYPLKCKVARSFDFMISDIQMLDVF